MKKLLTIAMMTAAVSALAVESSNTFGILRVDSSAEQTIVSVPWEGAGASGESANKIMVKDVVKTANLNQGDQLYYYAGGAYKMWQLNASGQWEGLAVVKKGENDTTTIEATAGGDDLIVRGGAIILVRPTVATRANCFYLYGQYTNSASSTTCVANGYTLLAPPSTTQTDLNTKTWSNVGASDYIILGNGKMLTYKNEKWGYDTRTFNTTTHLFEETHTTSVAVIAAGEGAWYVSNSETGASVVWATTPVQQ